MNELERALNQISKIHDQLARTRESLGVRALPAAASGVLGLVAAALQPRFSTLAYREGFLIYWTIVAAAALLIGGSGVAFAYFRDNRSALERG